MIQKTKDMDESKYIRYLLYSVSFDEAKIYILGLVPISEIKFLYGEINYVIYNYTLF